LLRRNKRASERVPFGIATFKPTTQEPRADFESSKASREVPKGAKAAVPSPEPDTRISRFVGGSSCSASRACGCRRVVGRNFGNGCGWNQPAKSKLRMRTVNCIGCRTC